MNDSIDWDTLGVPDRTRRAWHSACGLAIESRRPWFEEKPETDWRTILSGRYDALLDMYNGWEPMSPIEEMLSGWLPWVDGEWLGFPSCSDGPWVDDPSWANDRAFFSITAGGKLRKNYTLDFLVVVQAKRERRLLAIECDGHDFHERTKAQATRDKRRDREHLLVGVPTMRFTGSEIYTDARACFEHIQEAVSNMASDVLDASRAKN